jgi:hypothetical protein
MYALWKTQGITAAPWREDVQLGAARKPDGTLEVFLRSEWPWSGELRFDRPRHAEVFHMPVDYPRINQFPEWFVVRVDRDYTIATNGGPSQRIRGKDLMRYRLSVEAGKALRLTISDRAGN